VDSLTQITLGAAIGEASLGEKAGNRAVLWGAIAGLIPDLDIIPTLFMDEIGRMTVHRGFSHSILFSILFAPLLGYLIYRFYRRKGSLASRSGISPGLMTEKGVGFTAWTVLVFLCIITHIMLDCFTAYGTQVFYPFSRYRVALNSISIVDPLYTLPLLITVVAVLFMRTPSRRRVLNYIGLGISTLYLLFTLGNKVYVTGVFEQGLRARNIAYSRILTVPTVFNNILWMGVAEGKTSFHVGYYSILDRSREIEFSTVKKNHHLIEHIKDREAIQKLRWFTKGYFSVVERNGVLVFNSMRYGYVKEEGGESDYIFSFEISGEEDKEGKLMIKRNRNMKIRKNIFVRLIDRLFGNSRKRKS
jgi:inner membrane protein